MHAPRRLALILTLLAWPAGAEEITVRGGTIEVRFDGAARAPLLQTVHRWVAASAGAVAGYYGRFPSPHALVRITTTAGHEPASGQASGWNGPMVTISLGRKATAKDLSNDWMLPHELLHLCFPDLPEQHHWLEEGMAVYCESVARARAGLITPEAAWTDLYEGVPQGQPQAGDRGLDRTPTWGRTYWGGALFCLQADVEIRRRTGNRFGLEHALRAIAAAAGTIEHQWSIDKVIATGDRATGVPVLRELYDANKTQPVKVNLEALWHSLGIEKSTRNVRLLPDAPLDAVRQAIIPDAVRTAN